MAQSSSTHATQQRTDPSSVSEPSGMVLAARQPELATAGWVDWWNRHRLHRRRDRSSTPGWLRR